MPIFVQIYNYYVSMSRKRRKKNQRLLFFTIASIVVVAASTWCLIHNSCSEKKVSFNGMIKTYNKQFDDMNPTQLKAAEMFGIKPVEDRSYDFESDEKLVRIEDCNAYKIDELTHSVPYLTHAAAKLLNDIGEDFKKEIETNGLKPCKIIVTSVLRTKEDVRKLQKVNANASPKSTHCHATTFDIAYMRFHPIGTMTQSTKYLELLADVLEKKRENKECYVRFETNQHCFHITSRK